MTQPINPMEQIKCPNCGQPYAVRPDQWEQYSGRTINCTRCGRAFTVEARHVIPRTASPSPAYGQPPPYVPVGGNSMTAQQPAYGGMPYPIQPTTTSGFAVWSLVCGLLSFCVPVIGNLLAIIFGIIGIAKTSTPLVRGRGMAITGLILGIIAFPVAIFLYFIVGAMTPGLMNARAAANRIKCTSNMAQLGQAMLVYANANKGEFPDKLEDLLTSDPTIDRNLFICPDDDKTAPSGSVQIVAQGIASGKNCSYIYVGNGVTSSDPADTVLLYEPLTLHHQYKPGMNVLFADGHVQALDVSEGQAIVNQQAAGTRPIKSPAGP